MQERAASLLTYTYFTSFFTQLGQASFWPFLPIFAASLGASYVDIGVVGLASSLVQLPASFLSARLFKSRTRQLLPLAIVLTAASIGLLSVARNVVDIVALQLLLGLGSGIFWPITDALVSEVDVPSSREKVLGRYSASWGSSLLVGPLLGGSIASALGYRFGFVIAALIVASSLVLVAVGVLPGYEARPLRGTESVASDVSVRPRLYPLVLIAVVNQFAFSIVFSIFPRYASALSIVPLQIGALFSTYAAVRMVFFLTSHKAAIFGVVRLLAVSTVMMVAAQLTIGAFTGFPAFVLAFAFLGASSGIYIPTVINAFALSTSARGMTATMGVFEGVSAAGSIAGPLAGGAAADYISPTAPYLMSTGIMLLSLPVVFLTKKDRSVSESAGRSVSRRILRPSRLKEADRP